MKNPRRFRLGGPPLAVQIMGLLVGGLLVAQLVTLILTLVLPPEPPAQFELSDIAATLAGASDDGKTKGLQRIVQAGPPDVKGAGWLVSERSRHELATLMGVEDTRVSLAFFTPLPFAGAAAPRTLAMANDGFVDPLPSKAGHQNAALHIQYLMPVRDLPPGGIAPGTLPNGAMPGFHRGPGEPGKIQAPFPRSIGRIDRTRPLVSVDAAAGGAAVRLPDYGAGTVTTQSVANEQRLSQYRQALVGTGSTIQREIGAVRTEEVASGGNIPPVMIDPGADRRMIVPNPGSRSSMAAGRIPLSLVTQGDGLVRSDPDPVDSTPLVTQSAPAASSAARTPVTTTPPPIASAPVLLAPERSLPGVTTAPVAAKPTETHPEGPPITVAATRRTLFGIAAAPFVQGDFVAALKLGDGRWAIVQPAPEPFPNAWQRRVLLWFVLALALVAPPGWLFARRLVKPIDRFAGAAEQLGRDPAAEIGKLDGPAEIGRAAHAFNLMQNRLRAFVDDRTAMVGAISHDLRTPLTRMRFRIEDVDDENVRDGLLEEVGEMEAMIAQVIDFLRDASAPARRERLDLSTIVEDVVEDARLVGGDVIVEHAQIAQVEVDVLGMKRLFDNLLENAVKYGIRARIRLRTDGDEAVAEIIDDGPGLPEEEIEHVFEPFYRSESARSSDKSGSGLGLAVCRSIARAHGGDIRLHRRPDGFTAELRVPLVYGSETPVPA